MMNDRLRAVTIFHVLLLTSLILLTVTVSCIKPVNATTEPSNTLICICNYANKLIAQKKQSEAVALLEQIFKRYPEYELARTNLSIAYENKALASKDPIESISNAERAVALSPDDDNAAKNLSYALQIGKYDLTAPAARIAYADNLKSSGDDLGAFVEYQQAIKGKDDPAVQKKIAEIISPDEVAKSSAVGGPGASLLLKKIDLDPNKDSAFKFQYLPYVRAIEHKVRNFWKAPPALGNRKVELSFETSPAGTTSGIKVTKSSGDKAIDALAINAIKSANPFKPLPSDIFFDVPVTLDLDAHGDESPTYYLNGEAKPDGLTFSTGAGLAPMRIPKGVDEKLQAKADVAINQAAKIDQEIARLEQQSGVENLNLCPKLRAAATLYTQATEYKPAEERLNRAIKIAEGTKADIEEATALSQLGRLFYTINKNDEAEASLKKAVELFESSPDKEKNIPADRTAMEAYAKVLYKLNRVAEANVIYSKLKALAK